MLHHEVTRKLFNSQLFPLDSIFFRIFELAAKIKVEFVNDFFNSSSMACECQVRYYDAMNRKSSDQEFLPPDYSLFVTESRQRCSKLHSLKRGRCSRPFRDPRVAEAESLLLGSENDRYLDSPGLLFLVHR